MTTIMGIMGTPMSQVNLINNIVIYFGLPVGYALFIIAIDQVAPKKVGGNFEKKRLYYLHNDWKYCIWNNI